MEPQSSKMDITETQYSLPQFLRNDFPIECRSYSQNPPLHANTAKPINLDHKCLHYYQNQDNVHGWHKKSTFTLLNSDPAPEETNHNPAQNCVAAPISQQMQKPLC